MPLLGLVLPLPPDGEGGVEPVQIGNEPEVALALTMRSGPVVVEVDYRVDPDNARPFYDAMRRIQRARLRNGGFEWSLSRDIADPGLWTERYLCPTWGDYLRMRDRFTSGDLEAQALADSLTVPGAASQVRRRLERPFGSVRWKNDSPQAMPGDFGFIAP